MLRPDISIVVQQWILEYVEAWRERMIANGNIIPTNVGLDGKAGSAAGGKWYGGVYGWGFSVKVPQTGQLAHRNQEHKGFVGFMNAYALTGDDRWLEPWRKQRDAVNAQKKTIEGKEQYPTMYGDRGWYAYTPRKYSHNAREIYYLSMKETDRAAVPEDGWLAYLEGKNRQYPEDAMRHDLDRVRQRVAEMRKDTTTPDTRLADDPLQFNPASVTSLVEQVLGGILPGRTGAMLHCRLRWFDPGKRRAGLPEDVAVLVEKLTGDEVSLTVVNANQLDGRTVILQAGGYAEHQFAAITQNGRKTPIDAAHCTFYLAPGAGERLTLSMKRYVNAPTMHFPWAR